MAGGVRRAIVRTPEGVIAHVVLAARVRPSGLFVIAPGCPSLPCHDALGEVLSRAGWWVVAVRYRGTWESEGSFLSHEPTEDVWHIISLFTSTSEIVDAWSGTTIPLTPFPRVVVVGSSFGGPAALFASSHPAVSHVVALSPVVDWSALERGEEPLDEWRRRLLYAFPGAYRQIPPSRFEALRMNQWYAPCTAPQRVVPARCLIIHTRDDPVVPATEVEQWANNVGCRWTCYERGGHLGTSSLVERKRVARRVARFVGVRPWV